MRRKYKLTGCARFFIFLLIAGPIIFFTAQYVTGSSPWEEFKKLFKEDPEKTEVPVAAPDTPEKDTVDADTLIGKDRPETASVEREKKDEKPERETTPGERELLERIEDLEKRIDQLEALLKSRE